MADTVNEQARELYRTIRRLQRRAPFTSSQFGAESSSPIRELTIAQHNTLGAVREHGEMTISELASALQVSRPSVSSMVDRLVDMEMLRREHSEVDRREVKVSLSPEGESAAAAMENHMLESLVDLLERIGPEYARQWVEVYERVQGCLDEERTSETASQIRGTK